MLLRRRTLLLDTSFLIALENSRDAYHQRAVELDEQLAAEGARLLLHPGILLEVGDGFARLDRRPKGIALLNLLLSDAAYSVYPLSRELVTHAVELYGKRPDKEWGLTDIVSFQIMKSEGISEALTADIHFVQAGFRALLLEN